MRSKMPLTKDFKCNTHKCNTQGRRYREKSAMALTYLGLQP